MVAMTIAEAWPATSRPFTVTDLEKTPDDGRRYELVDGVLVVSPAPGIPHQELLDELTGRLRAACPRGLRAVSGAGVRMSADTELVPDIIVVRFEHFGGVRVTDAPVLAVEVRSPSTALFDMNTKKAAYERFGIASYWIVVPDVEQPELFAFDLQAGRYEPVAHVVGGVLFRAERPFPFQVTPAHLVAGLLPG